MARRLIIDTGVLVDLDRSRSKIISSIGHDDDYALAAITVAELQTGVELASPAHRVGREVFVSRILEAFPVISYDLAVAEAHSMLMAHCHRAGMRRGAYDLIVAATALATSRTIVTTDRSARFDDLPGVDALVVA